MSNKKKSLKLKWLDENILVFGLELLVKIIQLLIKLPLIYYNYQ